MLPGLTSQEDGHRVNNIHRAPLLSENTIQRAALLSLVTCPLISMNMRAVVYFDQHQQVTTAGEEDSSAAENSPTQNSTFPPVYLILGFMW